jgi:hypothetical protein
LGLDEGKLQEIKVIFKPSAPDREILQTLKMDNSDF